MKKKYFILLFAACSFIFFAYKAILLHKEPTYTHYKIGCQIYNLDFELVNAFNGFDCLFLKNGSIIMAQKDQIDYYTNKNELIWTKKIDSHHHIQMSNDELVLYMLGNDYQSFRGELTRFDKVVSIDIQSSKVIAEWSSFKHADELESSAGWIYDKNNQPNSWGNYKEKAKHQFLHFNSINLIPINKYGYSNHSEMSEGNLIISAGVSLVLFFNRHLKLLKAVKIDPSQNIDFHDAQVTEHGELLLYRNQFPEKSRTALQIFDLFSLQLIWQYPPKLSESKMYSGCCGSVQMIEDQKILFSDITNGGSVYEIDKTGKITKLYTSTEIDLKTGKPKDIFKVKKVNLKNFFSKGWN
ncbi:MAG: hypothetical protein H7281_04290 [Bacteriovorax sp.]|nr:hypothetical protein [Bacteriovorax sp.]